MTHNPATPFNMLASTGFSLGDAVGVTVMEGMGGSPGSAALASTGAASSGFDRFGFCSDTEFSSFLPASSVLRFYKTIG
jgi:hypothetical protein